ncbi:hypothetical protein B0A48_18538 [Cryoendolithus antarcticus]|uniref:DUF7770 domain-containing protein n=1 Tax=Cryoendolithus antarcticus TaxID=1507870 RepID=A0A1V8S8J6_9PEZI|nr:hypothetical protein B0A48_18538 [Cryoendolithus antarcticus]
MKTNPGYVNGIYVAVERSDHESDSKIVQFDFRAQRSFTFGQVHSMLNRKGFDRYDFTAGGIGCRHWNIIVLGRLERLGFVPQFSALFLHEKSAYSYSRLRDPLPRPIQQGTWDSEQTHQLALRLWQQLSTQLTMKIDREGEIQGLFILASNPEHRMTAAQRLVAMGVQLGGLAAQMPTRSKDIEAWESRKEALRVSAQQGASLAQTRRDEADDEDGEDEDDEENDEEDDG